MFSKRKRTLKNLDVFITVYRHSCPRQIREPRNDLLRPTGEGDGQRGVHARTVACHEEIPHGDEEVDEHIQRVHPTR